ncbi:MAG: guanylate kinase [Cycloclasticus sp.]|nr:MAG: guanylate kinase [Cycloclasticus sp.]
MANIGHLFIISAPSGAGKTSLVKALLEALSGIQVSVSHTTRTQRAGEEPGVDYHFFDKVSFQEIAANDGFLEHATVFGNSYGTSRELVEHTLNQGVDVILEIDWQGAQQVRKVMNNNFSIFILPPSKQVLEDRLRHRGQDSDEIIEKRMCAAVDEISHYNEYDVIIVNDDFNEALDELKSVVMHQRMGRSVTKQLHQELIDQLVN